MNSTTPLRGLFLVGALTCLALGCANPADSAPDAEVSEAAPSTATPIDEASIEFAIDPSSSISFVGSKVTGSHDGGFHVFDGSIRLAGTEPSRSGVNLTIDTTSLWADDERLTGHLKSADFFDVETFPTAAFESTTIEANADGGYDVTGNLTLHGVTKSIRFPATIEVHDGHVSARAEFSINRFDFDIVYPGKTDDLIREEVLIRFELSASATA